MQIDPDILPEDPASLQQMLCVLLHQQGELHAENDKLRLLIQRLTRQQFGRRSEQLTADQFQFGLDGQTKANQLHSLLPWCWRAQNSSIDEKTTCALAA